MFSRFGRLATSALRSRAVPLAGCAAAGITIGSTLSNRNTNLEAVPVSTPSVGIAQSNGTLDALLGRVVAFSKMATTTPKFVVIAPTFYPNLQDVRLKLGIEACRKAKSLGVPLLLVDASPPEVRAALEEAGATVHQQTAKGRKGAALRECVELARAVLPADGVICYQELEKVEMVGLQREVAAHIARSGCDVCVPKRADSFFKRTYPIEQYHQENFANLYLNTLGVAAGLPDHLDWTFGPVAFRASAAVHWLQCDGELWDAQIVPYVRAARWHGSKVTSLELDYSHPPTMKDEEEGVAVWGEKRLHQLNFLFKFVAGALREEAPPP